MINAPGTIFYIWGFRVGFHPPFVFSLSVIRPGGPSEQVGHGHIVIDTASLSCTVGESYIQSMVRQET